MKVRGAPAIAMVGCLSLAVDLRNNCGSLNRTDTDREQFFSIVKQKLDYLITARPTAVNMRKAASELETFLDVWRQTDSSNIVNAIVGVEEFAKTMLTKDLADNQAVGNYGAYAIIESLQQKDCKINVLTHCNTGSLATAGYGTALGVVRSLHKIGHLDMHYFTETRPYNQGSRLTTYEMLYEKIPSTLICDSMAGFLMREKEIHAVVTGADNVALNGDVANKIGTYSLAVLAKHHKIPFFIALTTASFDPRLKSGKEITIEERPWSEMTTINKTNITQTNVDCWNPAFDITPSELVTGGFITEFGHFPANDLRRLVLKIT